MKYYYLEPEFSSGLGDNTIMDTAVHPPAVTRLHYEFDGWLGDSMVTSFPCYIVTEDVKEKILKSGFSGIAFGKVEVPPMNCSKKCNRTRSFRHSYG